MSVRPKILVSAGEASGDLYASQLVTALRSCIPRLSSSAARARMRAAGVREIVDAGSLAVVGLVEVIHHIPRIYGEFRKLIRAAEAERPDLAILTDSPDFNLRVAAKLKRLGIPVIYLIAPQVWAWREGRVRRMRRDLARVLCIFPFEEAYFERHGVPATYIGHPLTWTARAINIESRNFSESTDLDPERPLVALLPGSRVGEVGAASSAPSQTPRSVSSSRLTANFVLAAPLKFAARARIARFFRNGLAAHPSK